MTRSKFNPSQVNAKPLTARQVYELTSQVLAEHLQLDMSNSDYEVNDIWDVLVAAAVQRLTIETASKLLESTPSPNTVRNAVYDLLGDDEQLVQLESILNEMLLARLPKKLMHKARPCAADFTEIPYQGRHEAEDGLVRRGRAKSGTTHFHCYATLYIVNSHKRYTLALTLVRRSDSALDALKRLLVRSQGVGLRIKRLYLDRGFDNNAVVAYLKDQSYPAIIPLTIRGKKGGTRQLLTGRKSYVTTYTRPSLKHGEQTFTVQVVRRYTKGRYRRNGVKHFAYIIIGKLKLTPQQVFEDYRSRFGIETSYRLMNTMRARTTSTCVALRLFFVALALLLLNLWSYVKWHHLFVPKRGPRQPLNKLLPLARWRLWLWEMIKWRQGFSLAIDIAMS